MCFGLNAHRIFQNQTQEANLPERFGEKTEAELWEIYERAKKEMMEITEDPEKDLKDLSAFLGDNYEALALGNYLKQRQSGGENGEENGK